MHNSVEFLQFCIKPIFTLLYFNLLTYLLTDRLTDLLTYIILLNNAFRQA